MSLLYDKVAVLSGVPFTYSVPLFNLCSLRTMTGYLRLPSYESLLEVTL